VLAVDEELIARTVDHGAIERLQRAYADAVNRRAWADLQALFLPGATVDLDLVTSPTRHFDGPVELSDFISSAMARFTFFEFVVLNAHVELWPGDDRNLATARVYMCELRQLAGEQERNDAFGLYQDTYVREGDTWRIGRRHYRSMARFPAGEVLGLPELQPWTAMKVNSPPQA